MEMIEIDGKEISMIQFIENKIRTIIRVCIANGSSIEGIVRKNGFFYDEKDFQISLVREFEKDYPKIKVFYEDKDRDIVLKLNENEEYQIELKYSYQYDQYDSGTSLANIIADSFGEDINFIKNFLIEKSKIKRKAGYFVVLANKNNKKDIKELLEKWQKQVSFSLDKRTLSGTLKYKDKSDDETKDGEITITNYCPIIYDEIENFHYLIIEISKQSAEKIISK